MGRQSSRNSRREQSRDPEIIESNNLNDVKFKTLVVKMLSELREVWMNSVRTSTKR